MEGRRIKICPFCRKPIPFTDEEIEKRRMKRVEANDPNAKAEKEGFDFLLKKIIEAHLNILQRLLTWEMLMPI